MSRVAAISAETHEVISLLARAMAEENGDGEALVPSNEGFAAKPTVAEVRQPAVGPSVEPNSSALNLESLDTKFHSIVRRLASRESWTRSEFEALAREFHLMPLSVFDAINEWADQKLGDFLLEGDDSIKVHRSLLNP